MNISKIDPNFKTEVVNEPDIVWHDPRDLPFSIHGVYFSNQENKYVRIPKSVA